MVLTFLLTFPPPVTTSFHSSFIIILSYPHLLSSFSSSQSPSFLSSSFLTSSHSFILFILPYLHSSFTLFFHFLYTLIPLPLFPVPPPSSQSPAFKFSFLTFFFFFFWCLCGVVVFGPRHTKRLTVSNLRCWPFIAAKHSSTSHEHSELLAGACRTQGDH